MADVQHYKIAVFARKRNISCGFCQKKKYIESEVYELADVSIYCKYVSTLKVEVRV